MGVNDLFEGTFEITTTVLKKGCAVGCTVCPQVPLVESYKPEENITHLSFEDFVTVLNKVPKTYRIDFAGYAEPFLNKDCSKMMQYAVDAGYHICCYTTLVGATLEDVEILSKLPFSKQRACPLHIHVPDRNGVMPIKITKKYREVLKNLLDRKLPFVSCMTMDSSGEPHPDILDLVGNLKGWEPISRANNIDLESQEDPEWKKDVYRTQGRIICKAMPKLNHNILMPNGDVQLCCMDYGLKHTLGNLLNQDHSSLFSGNEFQKIAYSMMIDQGEAVDEILCRNCELAVRVG
jgi:hypothetical protein